MDALPLAAGNAAVARLVGSRRVLARYDTGEHVQMGSDREVVVNGVTMTEGEVVAMGDFYENPSRMRAAPQPELEHLVELIRRDKKAYLNDAARVSGPDTHVSSGEWGKATEGPGREGRGYLDLAKANSTHFAPRASGGRGPDHRSEWWSVHRQALDKAHAATSSDDPLYMEALTDNAFAAHFLTDAFSAGHLVPKGDVMDRAKEAWDRQELTHGFFFFFETEFTRGVARRVLNHPKAGAKLAKYWLKLIVPAPIDVERFSEFLWQMAKAKEGREEFFNNFVKIVHDELNHGIKDGKGVDVENFNGDRWTLSGDETLELSPESLRIAKAAFEESCANVADAAATNGGLVYDYYFAKVWDYTPKPTVAGRERIDDVLDTLLQPERPEAQEAFAGVIIDNIDTIIEKLVASDRLTDAEHEREMEAERAEGMAAAMAWP